MSSEDPDSSRVILQHSSGDSSMQNNETAFSKVNTTKLVSLQYPGYIKNVNKMLATVGGEKTLTDTYYNGKCRLQMTYRPDDIDAHKACADLIPCTGLMMIVRRRKKHANSATCGYDYKYEILGLVKEQYNFQTLMDYQYLTPEPLWGYFKNIHGSEMHHENFPPYFPPPTFGRIDTCGSYNYRPDPPPAREVQVSNDMKDTLQNNTAERNPVAVARKRRQTESMAALFVNEVIPQKASQNATTILDNLMQGPTENAVNTARRLFSERPIWSKLAISYQIDIGNEKLRKILQYFCYYWLSGPWRTMWCRMGYDPRKDPKAKIYQMIDYRVRNSKESKTNYADLIPRRSCKYYVPRNLQSRALPHGSSVLAATEEPIAKDDENLQPYIYSPHKMLAARNMMYQLCDIHDPEVQKIIHENDGEEGSCSEKFGWFPPGTMDRIRTQITKGVNAYFESEKKKKKELLQEDGDTTDLNITEANEFEDTQSCSYLQVLQSEEDGDSFQDTEDRDMDEFNYIDEDDEYFIDDDV